MWLANFKKMGYPEDVTKKLEKFLEHERQQYFKHSVTLSNKKITIENYALLLWRHELEVAKRGSIEAQSKENRIIFLERATVLADYLSSRENFLLLFEANKSTLEPMFATYKKNAYRNNRFDKHEGKTFTKYILERIPFELKDIFETNAYKKSHGEKLKETEFNDSVEQAVSIDTRMHYNLLMEYFDDHPFELTSAKKLLSQRQLEVFNLINEGFNQKNIANQLMITEPRVTQLRKRIEKILEQVIKKS